MEFVSLGVVGLVMRVGLDLFAEVRFMRLQKQG